MNQNRVDNSPKANEKQTIHRNMIHFEYEMMCDRKTFTKGKDNLHNFMINLSLFFIIFPFAAITTTCIYCILFHLLISITNPCQSLSLEITKVVFQSHQISKSLKRMVLITQRINNRHSCMLCQFQNICVPIDSCQNKGIESTEYVCCIFHTFIHSKLNIRWSKEKSMTSKEIHSSFC